MQLSDTLSPKNVFCNESTITSKKQLLECISKTACNKDQGINYVETLQALIQRERLGSTAIGHGVAIPHARIPNITKPIVCLMTLHTAVNFYDEENIAVDIVFGILAPIDANKQQLNILADIATKLRNKSYRDKLRSANNNEQLYLAAIGT